MLLRNFEAAKTSSKELTLLPLEVDNHADRQRGGKMK